MKWTVLLLLSFAAYAQDDPVKLFRAHCMMCHGPEGKGDGPAARAMKKTKPRNFTKDPFKFGDSPEEIFQTITKGIPGTPMPSWKSLPEKKRRILAQFVHSLRPKN